MPPSPLINPTLVKAESGRRIIANDNPRPNPAQFLPGVATNLNRTNSEGDALARRLRMTNTSMIIEGVLEPGEIRPLHVSGSKFFLIVASGPLYIKTETQTENLFYPSTGIDQNEAKDAFNTVHVRNPDQVNNRYFQIFIGFDGYDDRRLVYPSVQLKRVTLDVYDFAVDAFDATIDIPDLSETIVTDGAGDEFYAIQRDMLLVFNSASTDGLYVKRLGSTRRVGFVAAGLGIQLPVTGDMQVTHSAASPIISEVYTCIPAP